MNKFNNLICHEKMRKRWQTDVNAYDGNSRLPKTEMVKVSPATFTRKTPGEDFGKRIEFDSTLGWKCLGYFE